MSFKPTVLAIVGLSLLAVTPGCADKGYQKADIAAQALTAAKAETSAAQIQLNKTVDLLDTLINRPAPDLKPQYQAYADALKQLNIQADKLHSRANAMEEKKAAWFKSWETQLAQIKDPEIRASSQARIDSSKAQYSQVADAYRAVQQSFGPLRQNLQDVNTALSNDLTQAGVKSVQPIFVKIKENQAATNKNLDALIAELGRVSAEFSSKIEAASTGKDPGASSTLP